MQRSVGRLTKQDPFRVARYDSLDHRKQNLLPYNISWPLNDAVVEGRAALKNSKVALF